MNIMHSCSFGSTVEINEVEVVDIRRSFLDIAPVRSMQFSLAAIAMGDVSVPVWELEEGHWGTTGGINMEGPQETSATNRLFHGCLPPPPPPHTHTPSIYLNRCHHAVLHLVTPNLLNPASGASMGVEQAVRPSSTIRED